MFVVIFTSSELYLHGTFSVWVCDIVNCFERHANEVGNLLLQVWIFMSFWFWGWSEDEIYMAFEKYRGYMMALMDKITRILEYCEYKWE